MKRDKRTKTAKAKAKQADREFRAFSLECREEKGHRIRASAMHAAYLTWRTRTAFEGGPISMKAFGMRAKRKWNATPWTCRATEYLDVKPPQLD